MELRDDPIGQALSGDVAQATVRVYTMVGMENWNVIENEIVRRRSAFEKIRRETTRGGNQESCLLSAIKSVMDDIRQGRM